MAQQDPTVFVVDDEEAARNSVCALVGSMNLRCEAFDSAEAFLREYDPQRPGCLITDIRMLGMSGMELQQRLLQLGIKIPVIVITAFAETPITVQAMQRGAVTLLEKPYDNEDLQEAIRQGLLRDAEIRQAHQQREQIRERLAELTPQEQEVLDFIVAGVANKVIARRLDVSIRTVEARRHNIFKKTGTSTVAELVQLVLQAEDDPDGEDTPSEAEATE